MKTVECKADLHNHMSLDEKSMPTNFNGVVNYLSRTLGEYGIVSITDTREERKFERFASLDGYERRDLGNAIYVPEKKLWIVRSQEAKTKNGHMLFIGGNEGVYIPSDKHVTEVTDEAKEKNLICVIPHAEGALGTLKTWEKIASNRNENFFFPSYFSHEVSGIEIFNGQSSLPIPFVTPFFANTKNLEFYKMMARWTTHAQTRPTKEVDKNGNEKENSTKVGALACSDGRSYKHTGKSYTILTMPHPDEIPDNEMLNWHLDGAIRESQLVDKVKERPVDIKRIGEYISPEVIERLAHFNGRREPAKLAALEHALLGVGGWAWRRYIKREKGKLIG